MSDRNPACTILVSLKTLSDGEVRVCFLKTPTHCQTHPMSCYGKSVERTNETTYRRYKILPSRATESDCGSGPIATVCFVPLSRNSACWEGFFDASGWRSRCMQLKVLSHALTQKKKSVEAKLTDKMCNRPESHCHGVD